MKLIFSILFSIMTLISFSQNNAETITAWGKIKMSTPMGNLPVGMPADITISLRGGSYNLTLSPEIMQAALSSGEFTFRNVPVNTPVVLEITYPHPEGWQNKWNGTFKFRTPDLNIIQEQFRKNKAYRIAGYMGEFTCPIPGGKITVDDRYKD